MSILSNLVLSSGEKRFATISWAILELLLAIKGNENQRKESPYEPSHSNLVLSCRKQSFCHERSLNKVMNSRYASHHDERRKSVCSCLEVTVDIFIMFKISHWSTSCDVHDRIESEVLSFLRQVKWPDDRSQRGIFGSDEVHEFDDILVDGGF